MARRSKTKSTTARLSPSKATLPAIGAASGPQVATTSSPESGWPVLSKPQVNTQRYSRTVSAPSIISTSMSRLAGSPITTSYAMIAVNSPQQELHGVTSLGLVCNTSFNVKTARQKKQKTTVSFISSISQPEEFKQPLTTTHISESQSQSQHWPSSSITSSVTSSDADSVLTNDTDVSLLARQVDLCRLNSNSSTPIEPSISFTRPQSIDTMLTTPSTIEGTIGILPPEIREQIWAVLSWSAAIHLAGTSKHYRALIDPANHGSRTERKAFLRSQEMSTGFCSATLGRSWFACTGCWRLKQEKRFNREEIILSRRKGGRAWHERRCLDCQVSLRKYKASERIINGVGKTMRLCKPCVGFRSGVHCESCHICESCLGTSEPGRCPSCMTRLREPVEWHVEGGRL